MTLGGKRGELKVEEKETVVKMYCTGEESIFNKKNTSMAMKTLICI